MLRCRPQFEIYVDGLGGVGEEELLPEVEKLVNAGPAWGLVAWGVLAVCTIITGLIEDAMRIAGQAGSFSLSSHCTTCEDLSIVSARRVIQFLVTINLLRLTTCGASSFSAALWLVYQCNLVVFYIVVLLPVSIGMLNHWLVKRAKQKLQLAQHNTERLLSVIKRIQLVRMGSSISLPMPPVAKLEESLLRANQNNESILSCREMRSSMHCALVRLKNTICCDHASTTKGLQVATIAGLERLSSEAFCTEKDLLYIAQWEAFLAKLAILKRSSWETIGYRSDQPNNRCHSYAHTYLTARQRIARLRAAYDDISTRLWLTDQQLSKAPLLQCLLPDPLHTANSDKDDQNDRVQLVDAALETLSHSTRTPSSQPQSQSSLTQNEILEGVELLLAGLPTLRDFELLCEELQLLREASLKGITPAQCKLGRMKTTGSVVTQDLSQNVSRSGADIAGELGESHLRYHATQGMYEAQNGASEALPTTSMSSLDPSHTSNILDVYTTIIPRRATKTKKAAIDPVDAAMAAQERAQAKKLFRELNQHLRRMHQPLVAAEDASSSANQVGVVHIPPAGCYTQQRVRNIGTTEPENGDFADEVEVQIETNFTQVDPSALGLCEDSDSESEEHRQESPKGAEVKAHRDGSMLLTTDELQAASILSPTHAALEFQNEMRQALMGMQRAAPAGGQQGLPLSAFASALRSNHLQEATFGDELSD
eukprot:gene7824-9332_t